MEKRIYSIGAVDGRYWKSVKELGEHVSEYGLMKNRVLLEVEYVIALLKKLSKEVDKKYGEFFTKSGKESEEGKVEEELRAIYREFTEEDFGEIQKSERETNHDVKAVE